MLFFKKRLLKARQVTEQLKEGGQNYDQMCSLLKRRRVFGLAGWEQADSQKRRGVGTKRIWHVADT